jgi:hypothetical protein
VRLVIQVLRLVNKTARFGDSGIETGELDCQDFASVHLHNYAVHRLLMNNDDS